MSLQNVYYYILHWNLETVESALYGFYRKALQIPVYRRW